MQVLITYKDGELKRDNVKARFNIPEDATEVLYEEKLLIVNEPKEITIMYHWEE